LKILRFLFWAFLSVLLFIAGAGAAAGRGSPLAALQAYVRAVKDRSYPGPEHCFS